MNKVPAFFSAILLIWLLPASGYALELKPLMQIYLQGNDGARLLIGKLHTSAQGGGYAYRVELDSADFGDEFLSMRPFRCLQGAQGRLCHLQYPYENRRLISAADLADLEYDLLFLRQGAGEYGINAWNGVYYKLTADAAGLRGVLHEVDLNILAIPPAAGELRPIKPAHISPSDAAQHWLPLLAIE